MSFDQPAPHGSPDTYSTAEFHYFVCDAIPATEEMMRSPRYGRPGDTPNTPDSTNDIKDVPTEPDRSSDEKRRHD